MRPSHLKTGSHKQSPRLIYEAQKYTQNGSKFRSQVTGPLRSHSPLHSSDSGFLHNAFGDAPRGLYLTRQPRCAKASSMPLSFQLKDLT